VVGLKLSPYQKASEAPGKVSLGFVFVIVTFALAMALPVLRDVATIEQLSPLTWWEKLLR